MKSSVVKRSIVIAGHKTSVSLEDAFWNALKEIAIGRDETLSHMVDARLPRQSASDVSWLAPLSRSAAPRASA